MGLFLITLFLAQTPTFEVAAIHPSKIIGQPSLRSFPGGRTVATNATLQYLIAMAYNVRAYQIIGGPKWLDSAMWDIDANPVTAFQPSINTRPVTMQMLQSLLKDRFQLRIRRETRDFPPTFSP